MDKTQKPRAFSKVHCSLKNVANQKGGDEPTNSGYGTANYRCNSAEPIQQAGILRKLNKQELNKQIK